MKTIQETTELLLTLQDARDADVLARRKLDLDKQRTAAILTFAAAICAGIGKTTGEEQRIIDQAVRLADVLLATLSRPQGTPPPPITPWLPPIVHTPTLPPNPLLGDIDHQIIKNTGILQKGDKIWSISMFADISDVSIGLAIQPGMIIQRPINQEHTIP